MSCTYGIENQKRITWIINNAIQEFSLAQPSWYIKHYNALYKCGKCTHNFWGGLFILLQFSIFLGQFNNTIIIITQLALVGYEMIIANLALCTSLALYHLLFNVSLWRNCKVSLPYNEQKPTKANLCLKLSSSTCFPVVTFWLSICSSSAFILKKKIA